MAAHRHRAACPRCKHDGRMAARPRTMNLAAPIFTNRDDNAGGSLPIRRHSGLAKTARRSNT